MTVYQVTGLLLSCTAFSVAASRLCAGETIVDPERRFTLTLPNGFSAYPGVVGTAPNIVHAFVLGDPNDDAIDIFLFIEKMRGTIGREHVKPEDLPPSFQGRSFVTSWQGFQIDGFEVPEQAGEIETVTYNVQIPLRRAAIQIKLFGPTAREAELKQLLTEILIGLKGESNWSDSAVSGDDRRLVLLSTAIGIIIGGLVALFLISKKTPKGTVLAIAAAIYVASWSFDGVRSRDMLLLRGSMRMLGFAGGILGIIDLVRKRKPHPKLDNDSTPSKELSAGSDDR